MTQKKETVIAVEDKKVYTALQTRPDTEEILRLYMERTGKNRIRAGNDLIIWAAKVKRIVVEVMEEPTK